MSACLVVPSAWRHHESSFTCSSVNLSWAGHVYGCLSVSACLERGPWSSRNGCRLDILDWLFMLCRDFSCFISLETPCAWVTPTQYTIAAFSVFFHGCFAGFPVLTVSYIVYESVHPSGDSECCGNFAVLLQRENGFRVAVLVWFWLDCPLVLNDTFLSGVSRCHVPIGFRTLATPARATTVCHFSGFQRPLDCLCFYSGGSFSLSFILDHCHSIRQRTANHCFVELLIQCKGLIESVHEWSCESCLGSEHRMLFKMFHLPVLFTYCCSGFFLI